MVEHFLVSQSGPDYMFASTAALLLRGMGYPTRLVSGFYAHEDRFDNRAQQTAVLSEDVHTWLEVYLGGHWIPIEPTPGYEQPRETLTWYQQLQLLRDAALAWCVNHVLLICGIVTAGVLGWCSRMFWGDWLLTAACALIARYDAAGKVRVTLRLLEYRSRLAGVRRPGSSTVTGWYSAFADGLTASERGLLGEFLRAAEQCLYSSHPELLSSRRTDQVVRSCSFVTRRMGAARLRRFSSGESFHA